MKQTQTSFIEMPQEAPQRAQEKPQRYFVPVTPPKPESSLFEAVGAFLKARFENRKYCDCMGLLPMHLDGCHYAPLFEAYLREKQELIIKELGYEPGK